LNVNKKNGKPEKIVSVYGCGKIIIDVVLEKFLLVVKVCIKIFA